MVEVTTAGRPGGTTERGDMFFVLDAEAELNREILRARDDPERMDALLRKNKRFILGCAYKTVRRFVSESDDEWSVALIAFHEAVMTYDAGKGSFRSFAGLVIRRRLLDHIDSQKKYGREIHADLSGAEPGDEEELPPVQLEVRRAVARQSMEAGGAEEAMRDEIEALGETLKGYGFTFFDLADSSPKARKTKEACARVIRALLAERDLLAQLRRTGTLPSKALCQRAEVPKKILENHRKYIIAASEILDGDYPGLAEYLRYVRKGSEGT